MVIAAFEPKVDKKHRYAVAVPAEGGIVVPIKSYETLEQLKEGYKTWDGFASKGKITRPYPIEFLDQSGKCRILIDLVEARE